MACRALTAAAAAGHDEVAEALLSEPRILATPKGLLQAACAAAANGHVTIIDLFLTHPYFDPSLEDSRLLRVAAQFEQLPVVDRLLADGRVNPGAQGNAATVDAAMHGHLAVLVRLLADRCVCPTANSNAAVRGAARNGHADCVAALLAHSSATEASEVAALEAAAGSGQLAVLEALLADDSIELSDLSSIVLPAVESGHLDVVRRLLDDRRVSFAPATRISVLCTAVRDGSVAVARLILAGDPKLRLPPLELSKLSVRTAAGSFSDVMLRLAAENDQAEIVQLLLSDPRVAASAEGVNEALAVAAQAGSLATVQALLADHCADPAAFDNWIVWHAATEGRVAVVKRLLADERVNPGACPSAVLDSAASHEELAQRFTAFELLLADPRVDPMQGAAQGIFKLAAQHGHAGIIQRLLSDPRVARSAAMKQVAFYCAAEEGHVEVVRLLLAAARVDPSAEGNRAINLAAQNNRAAVVSLLLSDPRVATALTPVDRAVAESVIRRSSISRRYDHDVKASLCNAR